MILQHLELLLVLLLHLYREIKLSDLKKLNDEIIYTVKSRSFLQHQVRSMVGAIKAVGENKWTLEHLDEAFRSKR